MFFDSLAIIVITFFAAVGMAQIAEWLLKNPLCKKIKHRVFIVAKLDFAEGEDMELALRSLLAETKGGKQKVFLDSEGASEETLSLCKKLAQRFEFSLFRGENELVSLFLESLHND